jgi:hypothetical protein
MPTTDRAAVTLMTFIGSVAWYFTWRSDVPPGHP